MKFLRTWLWDLLALVGVLLLTVGFGIVWGPLFLILPGAVLLALGVLGAKRFPEGR